MMEALEVFQKFDNQRAVGVCYQNLGCLTAKLDNSEITNALQYVQTAIYLQE